MKLKDWADRVGVSYLTAYRWFKSGKFPIPAFQTESGTIVVEDPNLVSSNDVNKHDIVSSFLKKTVEFSKKNASIEDFAGYIISNFQLTPLKQKTLQEDFSLSKNQKIYKDIIRSIKSNEFTSSSDIELENPVSDKEIDEILSNLKKKLDEIDKSKFTEDDKVLMSEKLFIPPASNTVVKYDSNLGKIGSILRKPLNNEIFNTTEFMTKENIDHEMTGAINDQNDSLKEFSCSQQENISSNSLEIPNVDDMQSYFLNICSAPFNMENLNIKEQFIKEENSNQSKVNPRSKRGRKPKKIN